MSSLNYRKPSNQTTGYRLFPTLLLTLSLSLLPDLHLQAAEFEPEKLSFNASDLVPKELMAGPHYRISDQAVVEGYLNNYTIRSDFGEFSAASDEHLRVLIGEIAAIAELQKISKTEAFANAVSKTATKPIKAIENVVNEPVETVKRIPKGVGRLLKRSARIVSDTVEKVEEFSEEQSKKRQGNDGSAGGESTSTKVVEAGKDYSKDWLGFNSAIRQLAKELKVDPYSPNKVLQKEMKGVAWAMAGGSLAMGEIIPSMPAEISQLAELDSLVWDSDPLDIRIHNEKILGNMGANEALIKAFYENKFFTTSTRNRLIGSLYQLKNAKNRSAIIADAAKAESGDEARLYRQLAETLAAYNSARSPIVGIHPSTVLPFAQTKSGTMICIVPIDYLLWTEVVDEGSKTLIGEMNKVAQNSTREIWVQGAISSSARANLSKHGWKILSL